MQNHISSNLANIPCIILCGGKGTRLYPDTKTLPKPLITIGDIPIVVHLIKYYESFGVKDFYLALGYKAEDFIKYFNDHSNLFSNETSINLIDTGLETLTGGRLLRLKNEISKFDRFFFTYGDGLSDVDLNSLNELHKKNNVIGTVTAVHPPARFGLLNIHNDLVLKFKEKPQTDDGWINGGFFIFSKEIFDYITDDSTILEQEPLENLAKEKQLTAFKHYNFWQCMDTPRDREILENLNLSDCPWRRK